MRKSITLICIILLVSVSLFGQNSNKQFPAFFKHSDYAQALTLSSLSYESPLLKSSHTNKQQIDSIVYSVWDESNNQWSKASREEYHFNDQNEISKLFGSDWDKDSNNWVYHYMHEYSYDINNNLTQELYYRWQLENELWELYHKFDYIYNNQGKLAEKRKSYYGNISGEWFFRYATGYFYNANKQLIETLEESYSSSKPEPIKNQFFTYNSEGKLICDSTYYWNDEEEWIARDKYEYTYDGNVMTQQLRYGWSSRSGAERWFKVTKLSYVDDLDNDLSGYIEYRWDKDSNQWNLEDKRELNYNKAYTINDMILPYYYSDAFIFHHLFTEIVYYSLNEESNNWMYDYKVNCYFSEHVETGIDDLKTEDIVLYPNPTKDNLHFRTTDNNQSITIKIYDVNGKLVLSQNINSNESINISPLNSGFYIYNISYNQKQITGKLIKQ